MSLSVELMNGEGHDEIADCFLSVAPRLLATRISPCSQPSLFHNAASRRLSSSAHLNSHASFDGMQSEGFLGEGKAG